MEDVKNYSLNYYHKNKEVVNKKRRQYYGDKQKQQAKLRGERFKEKHGKDYFKKYRDRDYNNSYYRKIKELNPEKYESLIKKNGEYRRNRYATDPEYREKEKKRCLEYAIARTHNSRVGGVKLNRELIRELYKKYEYRCFFCLKTREEAKLSIDHIKPISKGGTNESSNLQILCMKCNQSKSSKIL
jgi:5-methylcytosine-specific restriction enzyme A